MGASPGLGVPAALPWIDDERGAVPGAANPEAVPRVGSSPFPGRPLPLGATLQDSGTNFAILADPDQNGDGVELCLVDERGHERRLAMEERTYGIWHTFVPGITHGQRYGYRVSAGDASKLLLDPYARRVDTTAYDLDAACTPGVDTAGRAPLAVVTRPIRSVSTRPLVPWALTVLYEAHVAGLTALHPDVPERLRGTFRGVCHPAVIDHLLALQVTTLELLPVHAHATEPDLLAAGKANYWGYSTLGFFAPHPSYAAVPGRELEEFVWMVDTLHEAGIEVVLDVVYNHTCEGGPGKTAALSWSGFSPRSYYLPDGHDITGCGRTLDPGSVPVTRMVTDSLRYWAQDLGVDGFRFDLASVHGRPHGGPFDAGSALLTAIATDPVLSTRKLIAEPWDATGEGYAVGRFGVEWCEWNDRFRDSTRDFWRGVPGVRDMAYRLSGSSDLYGATRRPWASVNFITAHDGFTLRDLVSYDHKHNEANGEFNRDGTDNNRSANNGAEGETDDAMIQARRLRQARNLAGTMLLSTGTPMLTMGDEMWRTQGGNNNPYCQDNEIGWLDWSGLAGLTDGARHARRKDDDPASTGPEPTTAPAGMLAFVARTLQVRKNAPALHQGEFFEGRAPLGGDDLADLVWFTEAGVQMTMNDWFDGSRQTLLMWIDGRDVRGHSAMGEPLIDRSWLLLLHAGEDPITVQLPSSPYADSYTPIVDTDTVDGAPADPSTLSAGVPLTVPGRTLWLLQANRDGASETG